MRSGFGGGFPRKDSSSTVVLSFPLVPKESSVLVTLALHWRTLGKLFNQRKLFLKVLQQHRLLFTSSSVPCHFNSSSWGYNFAATVETFSTSQRVTVAGSNAIHVDRFARVRSSLNRFRPRYIYTCGMMNLPETQTMSPRRQRRRGAPISPRHFAPDLPPRPRTSPPRTWRTPDASRENALGVTQRKWPGRNYN